MSENISGFNPTENKCLVKPIEVEKVSKGGIIFADTTTDSEKFKQTKGRLIAVSPLAFNYATIEEWALLNGTKPQPGEIVGYAKFAGLWIKGDDGEEYLVLNDKDILGTWDKA